LRLIVYLPGALCLSLFYNVVSVYRTCKKRTIKARLPIILRPCDWHSAPFGKLQALSKDSKPVTQWSDQDEAFLNIAQGIRKAVAELQKRKNAQPNPNPAHPPASIPTQITYDLCGANIGNWAENQYGTQHATQIQPNPSQPPETPQ
jgi:hypothetical protein